MRFRSGREPELLFRKYDGFKLAESKKQELKARVAKMSAEEIDASTVDELAAKLAKAFGLRAPVLADRDQIEVEECEVQIDVGGDFRYATFGRGPHLVTGVAYDAHIPFDGEAEFFHVQASQFTTSPPRGRVDGHHLVFTVQGTDLKGEQVNSAIEGFLKEVGQHLGYLSADFQKLDVELPRVAHQAVEQRRAELAKRDSVRDEIGFKVRKSS